MHVSCVWICVDVCGYAGVSGVSVGVCVCVWSVDVCVQNW
jgi:hypothetical protein